MRKIFILFILFTILFISGCNICENSNNDNATTSDNSTSSNIQSKLTEVSVTDDFITVEDSTSQAVSTEDIMTNGEFFELIKKARAGDLTKEEVDRIVYYVDNGGNSVNWDFVKKLENVFSYDELSKLETELNYKDVHLNRNTANKLQISDRYPVMDLQTICDIINNSKYFENMVNMLSDADKIFRGCGRSSWNDYFCSFDFDAKDERYIKSYIRIRFYEDVRDVVFFFSKEGDPTPYHFILWSDELQRVFDGSNKLTPDLILNNLVCPDDYITK